MELARNLKVESVSRLRSAAALCLAPEQTVAEAVAIMREQRTGCVLVTCPEGRVGGIFTERDLLRRVLAEGRPLSAPLAEVMTEGPVTVQTGEPIGLVVQRMQEGGYRHLPVVDGDGQPVGVLSVKRIVQYVVEHFPSTIYCLPPDPDVFPLQREGA
ncbi:MAG: CBS domain-containing protein [Gemmataceae bacterium]